MSDKLQENNCEITNVFKKYGLIRFIYYYSIH